MFKRTKKLLKGMKKYVPEVKVTIGGSVRPWPKEGVEKKTIKPITDSNRLLAQHPTVKEVDRDYQENTLKLKRAAGTFKNLRTYSADPRKVSGSFLNVRSERITRQNRPGIDEDRERKSRKHMRVGADIRTLINKRAGHLIRDGSLRTMRALVQEGPIEVPPGSTPKAEWQKYDKMHIDNPKKPEVYKWSVFRNVKKIHDFFSDKKVPRSEKRRVYNDILEQVAHLHSTAKIAHNDLFNSDIHKSKFNIVLVDKDSSMKKGVSKTPPVYVPVIIDFGLGRDIEDKNQPHGYRKTVAFRDMMEDLKSVRSLVKTHDPGFKEKDFAKGIDSYLAIMKKEPQAWEYLKSKKTAKNWQAYHSDILYGKPIK